MQVQLHSNPEALANALAAQTASAIAAQPVYRFCAATGNSPTLFYQALVGRKAEFAKTEFRLLQLDEWGGVPPEHPGTCISYLQEQLIGPLGLKPEQCIGFQSNPLNPLRECARMQEALAAEGKIDLCVLGLGTNGHLAFNEPGSFLQPYCHLVRLSEASLQHSMAVNMPHAQLYGLTLGMADILSAQKIVMIVTGYSKREILQQVLHKQVSSHLPASFLWLHPKVELWVDEAAWPG
jgi:galactosamine-6-phosphate isomerase